MSDCQVAFYFAAANDEAADRVVDAIREAIPASPEDNSEWRVRTCLERLLERMERTQAEDEVQCLYYDDCITWPDDAEDALHKAVSKFDRDENIYVLDFSRILLDNDGTGPGFGFGEDVSPVEKIHELIPPRGAPKLWLDHLTLAREVSYEISLGEAAEFFDEMRERIIEEARRRFG